LTDRQKRPRARHAHALLGPEIDLRRFYRLAEGDPLLHTLATRFRGLKPPRFPSLFECLVNAIACQQLTSRSASACSTGSPRRKGTAPGDRDGSLHAFPASTRLAGLAPKTPTPLGFSGAQARSIVELAGGIRAETFDPSAIEILDDREALRALMQLRGVGRWSAEYALLRGLGRLHVFPGDDVGARNNLARLLDRPGPLDYTGVQAAVHDWRPFAGLVYFHLLLANLVEQGALNA
jgi:DNA-3-methyladenine glycosylase II